jgi:Kae1-associated kinase Bud32
MQELKIIQQGAEANIILDNKKNIIIKDRISKSYRIAEIDKKIRVLRTRSETKLLEKASHIINTPKPETQKDKYTTQITMPFIKGKKLSENLDILTKSEQKKVCTEIGKSIAKLHDNNIIHGDLTTSNIILDNNNNIWFIDFGLGFISTRTEDKAVDLHLIKQALEAKHFKNWEKYTEDILNGYKISKNATQKMPEMQ